MSSDQQTLDPVTFEVLPAGAVVGVAVGQSPRRRLVRRGGADEHELAGPAPEHLDRGLHVAVASRRPR